MTAASTDAAAAPADCLEIKQIRALRGPNVWGRVQALEALVGLGSGCATLGERPGLAERLLSRLPALGDLGGAETLAGALQHATLALQIAAGCRVSFGKTVAYGPGEHKVVVEYREEEVGRQALEAAHRLVEAAWHDRPFDAAATIRALREKDEDVRLGPSTGSIVRAAQARGIPVRRLNDGSLVQLGWGSRARRILAAESDSTSAIAESIAQDKELTKELLRAVGVPVPKGRPVEDAEDAWAAAQEIGVPVVVKPKDGNQGRGVAVNLTTREQVLAAYAAARQEGSRILVERFAPGADYRVLVIGGRVVAAARREPPQVRGDGVHTVAELVAAVNADPRRSEGHATSLSRIRLDDIGRAVLADQGLKPDSIPEAGRLVVLRRNANLSTGGTATDVTEQLHPWVAARAVDAAAVVGLDIAGVDVLARDISRPLEEQGGVVVEVNAAPGLRMHLEPSYGRGRPVGEAIVDSLFDKGEDGRIPVVAISGTNGKTTTARLVSHIFKVGGACVGMTCTDGIYIDDRRIDDGDCSGPKSARSVLLNPQVDAAVLETARGGILREGLGFDRCDVAVVTNIGLGDHLGIAGIATAEQLAAVKRVIVENVAPGGAAVLNAADPLVVAMAPFCPGSVVWFARDGQNPVLREHRARGGRVAFVRDGIIVSARGDVEERIIEVAAVPVTLGGRVGFEIENALAAAAAARAAGVALDTVRAGLGTFVSDLRHAPARFNVLQRGGATVIVDYGHNVDAMRALVDAVEHLPHRRRTVVTSAAGDRRDEDIRRMAQVCGDGFDEVILFEDACNRGRADGEILAMMRRTVSAGRRAVRVDEVRGEFKAIELGLRRLRPGDLVLVLVDQIEPSIDFIERTLEKLALEPRPAVRSVA